MIENATSTTLNAYTTQKLKNPTGMTGSFFPVGYNNVFFSNARSIARFGLLILNKGNWDGNQIMTDTSYFEQMVNTSQSLNLSYGYLWWLNGKPSFMVPGLQFAFNGPLCPNAPSDMVAAMGKDGQFINVVESKNMVWVRMGNSPDGVAVPFLMNDEIWQYINALEGHASDMEFQNEVSEVVHLLPNPGSEMIVLKSELRMQRIELLDAQGQKVLEKEVNQNECRLDVSHLAAGLYFVRVTHSRGNLWMGK